MEVTKCNNFKLINEFTVTEDKQAWLILINLIIQLNFLRNKNIEFNLNPDLLIIDEENNVIINLINLAFSESSDKEEEEQKDENNITNDSINIKENKYNNEEEIILINHEEEIEEIKKLKNKQELLSLFLGIILSDLFSEKK